MVSKDDVKHIWTCVPIKCPLEMCKILEIACSVHILLLTVTQISHYVTHTYLICTMALLFDNLEAIVLKRCLAFEPRAVRTKIGFPFCPLASVYTSMPDVFQARRNLQSHFSKSRLDCAHCIASLRDICPALSPLQRYVSHLCEGQKTGL